VAVEVAGRLVREHAGRPRHERARERRALPLAARELTGRMVEPLPQADFAQDRGGPLVRGRARHAPDQQGHRDVLERRELHQEMVELVHEAERLVAQPPALGVGERGHRAAENLHLAAGGRIQSAEQVEQRALARARRADDRDHLARRDGHVHAQQHPHRHAGVAVRLLQPAAGEDRLARGRLTHSAALPPVAPATHASSDRASR
jgi:hypothetical protein